jgi:hypothetical protein
MRHCNHGVAAYSIESDAAGLISRLRGSIATPYFRRNRT